MPEPMRVAVLVGSLRAGSFSRKIAQAMIARSPAALDCRIVEIGELPLYNEDLETDPPPPAWARLRDACRPAKGVLFVTPEYNRSIPGCLKNAIDVASRPYGKGAINGRAAGVVSVSPGKLGAFGANHALRQSLVFLGMPAMTQPEAYIGEVKDILGPDGEVANKSTAAFLQDFMTEFAAWVRQYARD